MSFRDRFFSPPVARAITSPTTIALTGAGVAVGILATGGVLGAVLGGVVAFSGRIGVAIPRRPRGERIDPYTLRDPWNRLVQDALAAQRLFDQAMHHARRGPLTDRLTEIGSQIDSGVRDCWRIAQAGNSFSAARARIDSPAAQRELDEVRRTSDPTNATVAQTVASIEAQIAAAERLDETIVGTRDRLRLLNARLDEAVTRSIELSAGSGDAAIAAVDADVGAITSELEALRQAIAVTDAADVTLPAPGSPPT